MAINIYIILLVLFYFVLLLCIITLYYLLCIIYFVLFTLYYLLCIIYFVLFYYIYTALKEGDAVVVELLAFPFTFSMVTLFQFAGKRSPNILFPIAGPNHLSG